MCFHRTIGASFEGEDYKLVGCSRYFIKTKLIPISKHPGAQNMVLQITTILLLTITCCCV